MTNGKIAHVRKRYELCGNCFSITTGYTDERDMMVVQILGLCRGDGKGYVKIATNVSADNLKATIKMTDNSILECPVVSIGFPGEDMTARVGWGDISCDGVHESVVVVPLLDGTRLTITITDRNSHTVLGSFPFHPIQTKIKSRLTYRLRPEFAAQIRGIEQRRISGTPHAYVTGIYPVDEQHYSCRFHVRYPYFGMQESCSITVFDAAAHRLDLSPIILEDSLITDPHDHTRQIHELVYSIIVTDSNKTICIQAKPEHQDACFTCILPPMFDGFVNGARDLTKHASYDDGYHVWFEQHRATVADIRNQRRVCQSWTDEMKPLISIVTVIFHPPVEYLQALIDSFTAQSYDNFEVVFVNVSGHGPEAQSVNKLLDKLSDPRFRVITEENKSIADNTNIGIRETHGDYIAFVDHDDVIEPDALYRYISVLHSKPDADVLYCDEDLLDNGRYTWPVFKPDYNPDLLNAYNYVTHMLVISRTVFEQVELSPADVSGAQDFDLTLKCCERARLVTNVPYMLYHWRMHQNSTSTNPDSKPYAETAGRIALERHFERTDLQVEVSESELPFRYRNRYIVDNPPKISIVIPTKDHSDILRRCLNAVLTKTEYQNYDITLVENNSTESETFAYYDEVQKQSDKIKVVTWQGTGFNYSAICNYGAAQCDGEILLFLNNDTEVINSEWLGSMVSFFARPEVGVVGAKLLFPDNLVQHGGVWVSSDQVGYLGDLLSHEDGGYMETMRYPYNCAAVTGACQMVRRSVFDAVGGFDEELAVVLNDVDLCLKIGRQGFLVVFDPEAKLYHSEHTSRGRDEQDVRKERRAIDEQARFYARWDKDLQRGVFINHQLNQYDGHYKIAW